MTIDEIYIELSKYSSSMSFKSPIRDHDLIAFEN